MLYSYITESRNLASEETRSSGGIGCLKATPVADIGWMTGEDKKIDNTCI